MGIKSEPTKQIKTSSKMDIQKPRRETANFLQYIDYLSAYAKSYQKKLKNKLNSIQN